MEAAGADALYTTNTLSGHEDRPAQAQAALGNGRGPICGPAIRPIGVLRTWELYEAVRLPIIASGGIRTWEDAVEYLLAGACAAWEWAALNLSSRTRQATFCPVWSAMPRREAWSA
ncbi:MAG: hypothetical protein ACLU9S_05220 [Oscillospiraceae bacterium]